MNDSTCLRLYSTCDWEQSNLFNQCINVLCLIKLLFASRLFRSSSFIAENWAMCSAASMIIQVILWHSGHCHVLEHVWAAQLVVRWNTSVWLLFLSHGYNSKQKGEEATPFSQATVGQHAGAPHIEKPLLGCQGAEHEELTKRKAGGATLEQRGGKQNMPSSPRGWTITFGSALLRRLFFLLLWEYSKSCLLGKYQIRIPCNFQPLNKWTT